MFIGFSNFLVGFGGVWIQSRTGTSGLNEKIVAWLNNVVKGVVPQVRKLSA
jgi:hypothetical protein